MFCIGGGVPQPYLIQKSIRYRAGSHFSRIPSSASNRKIWTWSGWLKRGAINGIFQTIFGSIQVGGANYTLLAFNGLSGSEGISVYEYPTIATVALTTTAIYRDTSSWYHVVLAYDTTQATASNRIRLYVNGVEINSFATDNRASLTINTDSSIKSTNAHSMGWKIHSQTIISLMD